MRLVYNYKRQAKWFDAYLYKERMDMDENTSKDGIQEELAQKVSSEEATSAEPKEEKPSFDLEVSYQKMLEMLTQLTNQVTNLLELVDKLAPVTDSVGEQAAEAGEEGAEEALDELEDLDYNLD